MSSSPSVQNVQGDGPGGVIPGSVTPINSLGTNNDTQSVPVSVLSLENFTSELVSQVGGTVSAQIFSQLSDVLPSLIDQAVSKRMENIGIQEATQDTISVAASDNLDQDSVSNLDSLFEHQPRDIGSRTTEAIGASLPSDDLRVSVLRNGYVPSQNNVDISAQSPSNVAIGAQTPSIGAIGAQSIQARDEGAPSEDSSSLNDLVAGKRKRDDLDMVPSILESVDEEMPDSSDLGGAIAEGLATRVEKCYIQNSAVNKSLQDIMKQYKCPSNSLLLRVPKVPPQLKLIKNYSDNNSYVKSIEGSLYSTQNFVAKSAVIFTNIAAHVLDKAQKGEIIDAKQVTKDCLRGITLLGHVSAELEQKRKNNLRNVLDSKFHSMCGPKPGSDEAKREKPKNCGTEFLFGDDFQKVSTDAKNLHNMAKRTSNDHNSNKSSSSSASFLDKGKKSSQPPPRGKNSNSNNGNSSNNNNNYNNNNNNSNRFNQKKKQKNN